MQYSCEKFFCATQTNDSSYLVCIKNSATGATCRARTDYISGTPAITPRVLVVFVFLQSLVFCVVFCRSLFVLFLLAIILSVILFPSSDCLCGIYQTFRVDIIYLDFEQKKYFDKIIDLCLPFFDIWVLITQFSIFKLFLHIYMICKLCWYTCLYRVESVGYSASVRDAMWCTMSVMSRFFK
jgi:hypothetical protein